MSRGRRRSLPVLVMGGVLVAAPAAAVQLTVPVPGDGHPIRASGPWVIELNDLPEASDGRVAFLLDQSDITGLFRRDQRGRFTYASRLQPLPTGPHELVVYLVRDPANWEELTRIPVQVLTAGGNEETEWQPRLEMHQKSQYDEGVSGSASASARPTFNDIAGQGGLATRHRRGAFEILSSWNVVGSSHDQEALRYAELGDDAPKVDLSDFLIDLHHGNHQFALGQVTFGNQPLLLAGLSNRGLAYTVHPTPRLEIGATAQNAQRIVGYDHLLGVNSSDNYVAAVTLGYELLANRAGGLRIDFMLLDAKVLSHLDFNAGQVPDAEKNLAYGARLSGSSASGRLRASMDFASSRYVNPDDPLLAQGGDIVAVRESTDSATVLDLSFDALQDRHVFGHTNLSLTLGYRHDRIDPLFKAVGGNAAADREADTLNLSGMLGQVSVLAQHQRSEDNLDNIPTILKTRTELTNVGVALPLQSMTSHGGTAKWYWPQTLSYNFASTHQYGANQPPSFDPTTHIPDQVSVIHNLTASWALGMASLSYNFSFGDQDNRQPARALADFQSTSHGLSLGLPIGTAVTVSAGATLTDAKDIEQAITRTTDSYLIGMDWRVTDTLSLRGNYAQTRADDNLDIVRNESYTLDTELGWRFELPGPASRKLPGQLFIRYSTQRLENVDEQFEHSSLGRSWTLNGGFTLGLQ